jgi:hypothetical protein
VVARDLRLPPDWLNTGPALQWRQGLPPGVAGRVHWRRFGVRGAGGLWVGLVDRYDLVFFKLYAAADSAGPQSVHYQDLLALAPSARELRAAASWVRERDPSARFHASLERALTHAGRDLGHDVT